MDAILVLVTCSQIMFTLYGITQDILLEFLDSAGSQSQTRLMILSKGARIPFPLVTFRPLELNLVSLQMRILFLPFSWNSRLEPVFRK